MGKFLGGTARGFIAAKSYLLKNAMSGTAPNFFIDPALVKVSYGNLELPQNITVAKADDDHIQFTWEWSACRRSASN